MLTPSPILSLTQPRTFAFGPACANQCPQDLLARQFKRIFIITSRSTAALADPLLSTLRSANATVSLSPSTPAEPTITHFNEALSAARDFHPDAVIGLGGGSVMDVAKLVASLHNNPQPLEQTFGINNLTSRSTYLACLPTTAGTGSEVSPNAILLDEQAHLKKGVISPHLMPDAAYIDPLLTLSCPPAITASTGLDALTHCIEAYANKLAHPFIDVYALEGIRLISANLRRAYDNGQDVDARSALLLGSTYGGMCLGPVNTAAVHALSYPLGGEFHVPHGVANALLLPHVLEFNLPAAPDRYANIATAMTSNAAHRDPAARCVLISHIRVLSAHCGIPQRLRDFNIPESAIPRLAESAMTVTRLLDRNVRPVTLPDAIAIYRSAF